MKRMTKTLIILVSLFVLALFAYPAFTRASHSDLETVKAAWKHARAAGSYRFTTTIAQTTQPLPSVANIGRASYTDRLYIEGETNLPERAMSMRLWSQGGSVLAAATGAELRVKGDQAFFRAGDGEWEPIENFTGLYAADGDFLAFLSAARSVKREDVKRDNVAPLLTLHASCFTFDIDGRSYAMYVRDQIEKRLAEKGELPPGLTLDLPRQYVDMQGTGELWIGSNGLPLRQVIHLEFPPRPDEQQIVADITTDFADFGLRMAERGSGLHAAAYAIQSAIRHLPSAAPQMGMMLGALLFAAVLIANPHSKKVYAALAVTLIVSMVLTPLLQSAQAADFARRHASRDQRPMTNDERSPTTDRPFDIQSPISNTQYPMSNAHSPIPNAQFGNGDDSDSDGLTDVQESLLGTNPQNVDTDRDWITDTLEVQGFTYYSRTWYLDPLKSDTNGDGINDGLEWHPDPAYWDTDNDSIPDAFDADNDDDGVPDRLDLSPFTKSGLAFSDTQPFALIVNNLTPDQPTYVEFQLRPTNPDHLWYAFNVLDWPMGDTKGQMQDVDGKTFYQVNSDWPRSPNDNGDLKLIPMLEIRVTGSPNNLPPAEELEPYGVFIREMNQDGSQLAVYAPLYLLTDDTGGNEVAFAGKMLYRPGNSWGNAHELRLVWVIQALVDVCTEYKDGKCKAYEYNQPQVIHTYYDDWTLTGLAITEHHGVEAALIYEDPTQDNALDDDALLLALADGLDYTFLAGRDADGDGQRDLTIAEIHNRFDRLTNVAISAEQRWNIPDGLRVATYTYPHQDVYLQHVATDTRAILNNAFTAYWSASAPITPTLLFAREERTRSSNLDAQAAGSLVVWDGRQLTVDLPLSGESNQPVQSVASLNWIPYRYNGVDWVSCSIDAYWDELARRYPFAARSDAQTRAGLQLGTQLYYLSLYGGAFNFVQMGDALLSQGKTRSDPALAAKYAAAWANVGGQTRPGEAVIEAIFDPLQEINPDTMAAFWQDLGQLAQAAGLSAGGRLKSPSAWPVHLAANFKWMNWGEAGGVALSGTVFGLAQTISGQVFEKSSWPAYDYGYGRDIEIPGILPIATSIVKMSIGAVSIATSIKALHELYHLCRGANIIGGLDAPGLATWMKSKFHSVTKTGKALAVLTLLIDLGLAWYTFYALTNDMEAFSPQFNMLLARAIAATILAILFFMLNLTIIGSLITAIFSLVDGLVELTTGFSIKSWLIDQMAKGLYTYEVTVDVDKVDTAPLTLRLQDPYAGFAAGNVLVASTRITTTISSASPQNWRLKLLYRPAFYTESKLKRTTLKYTLTPEEEDVSAGKDQMRSAWNVVKKGLFNYEGVARSGQLETRSPLQAGVNRSAFYLNTGYALPAAECWTIWVFLLFGLPTPIPVCYDRTFKGHTSTDMDFKLDIFPASLDEFYSLVPTTNGGYRLAWDAGFPPLMDADGDGLLSAAYNGADADDGRPDMDGDGLSDQKELRLRAIGILASPTNPDTDGDGLSDWEEIQLGTDPNKADTDNDGLPDGVEVNGWIFEVEGVVTHVTSNPLRRDSDGDGINDLAEYALGAPYHPMVWNTSPIGLYTETDDEDNYVYPGQTLLYTATVRNNLDQSLYAHGHLVADFPQVLGVSRNMNVNGIVRAIAASQDGAYLYVGGSFTQAGGVTVSNIARWNRASDTWSALGSGVNGVVYVIAVQGDEVYVGGQFDQAGGQAANRIARWDNAAQTWSALGSGVSSPDYAVVYAIAVSGDEVYVGGHFAQAGGLTANHVARWNRRVASWAALSSGMSGFGVDTLVSALAAGEGVIYVGGRFTTAGGVSALRIAAWNRAAKTWTALGSGVGEYSTDSVRAIAVWSDNVYVAGNFTQAGGQSANRIARWDPDNKTWSALGGGVNNTVNALAINTLVDVYVGGDFTDRVIRWTGVAWETLGSGVNNTVHAAAVSGSQIVFGGEFTQAGGRSAARLAAWNDLLQSWAWPDQIFFTLAQGEQAVIKRALQADPAAVTQPAPIAGAQRSQFNDVGYAGSWDWAGRQESYVVLPTGQRAWSVTSAPLLDSGQEAYRVAALVGDALVAASLRFDGSDDYAAVSQPITLTGSSFTVEFWAKRAAPGSFGVVVGHGAASSNRGLHVGFRDTNVFTCGFYSNNLDTPAYTDSDWHHWACTYDAGTNRRTIYRDGAQVAQDTASADYQGAGSLNIGRAPWNKHYFGGLADEVRLWSGVRTQVQIRANMNRRLTGSESGLIGYWPLNEGAGNVIHDQTANGNHGVLINGVAWDAGAPLPETVGHGRVAVYATNDNGLAAPALYVDDGAFAKLATPPAIACNRNAVCLTAWTEVRDGRYAIYGAIVSADLSAGVPFTIAVEANADNLSPVIAGDGSHFVVGWERRPHSEGAQIRLRPVSAAGAGGAAQRLDDKRDWDATLDDARPALAWVGHRYLVAWEFRQSPTDDDVWMAGLDSVGVYITGSAQRVAPNDAANEREPQIAYNPDLDQAMIAYRYNNEVRGRLAQGHNLSNEFIVSEQIASNWPNTPRLAYDPVHASWLVAWNDRTSDDRPAVSFQAMRGDEAGPALYFDGGNDHVNAGSGIALANASFTIEFWAKRGSNGTNDYAIAQGTDTQNKGLHIGFRDSNVFMCAFYGNDLNTSAYTDLNWHHWACTYDAVTNERIIYRDGVQVAQGIAATDYQGSGTLYIGRGGWGDGRYFHGILDEARIWKTVRSQTQIQANMNRRLSGAEANLAAYWRLDENSGTIAHDQTANGHHGTLVNGPTWTATRAPYRSAIEKAGEIQQYVWASELSPAPSPACPAPMAPRALWLRFDEAPGVVAFTDDSGNGNDGVCAGAACPDSGVVGRLGAAARFDGSKDWVQGPDLDIGDDFSIALWVKPGSARDGQALVAKHATDGSELIVFGLDNGGYEFNLRGQTYRAGLKTTDWQHLAVVGRKVGAGTEVTVYKDGQALWQRTLDAVVGDLGGGKGWSIGQAWDGPSPSNFFGGMLDEVVIFNGALSAAQIAALYAGSSPACALVDSTAPALGPGRLYYNRLSLLWPARWMGVVESPEPVIEPVFIDADLPVSSTVTSLVEGQYVRYDPGQATLVIGGQAYDADSGVDYVDIQLNESGAWKRTSGEEVWAYAWAMPAVDGPYTFRTRAADKVGHIFTEASPLTVIVDSTPPEVTSAIVNFTIISPAHNAQARWIIPLRGTAYDPPAGARPGSGLQSVEVLLEGAKASVAGNGWQTATLSGGDWTMDYVLPLVTNDKNALPNPTGGYNFYVRAADNVGNRTPEGSLVGIYIRVDADAPIATLTYTGPSTSTITQTLTLQGVITDPGPHARGLAGLDIAFAPADSDLVLGDWVAKYYNSLDLSGPIILQRSDAAIDFDWGYGAPHPAVNSNAFSVRWEQQATFKAAGLYRFESDHDNGLRVYVDSAPVLEAWADQAAGIHSADAYVTSGAHTLRVEYYHKSPLDGGGVPVAQPAQVRLDLSLVELDPGWSAASLANWGNGITNTTWSYVVPTGLDGIYRILLRGRDMFDNRAAQSTWSSWQGEIDTRAPQLDITARLDGSGPSARTTYTCLAQDFTLIQTGFECPCPGAPERAYYNTDWWRTWVSDTTRLYELTASCILPGRRTGEQKVRACDAYRCAEKSITPLLMGVEGITAIKPESFIFTPTNRSLSTTLAPVNVAGAAIAQGSGWYLRALTVTVDGAPIDTLTWAGTQSNEAWATSWTPTADGPYTLLAVAVDSGGQVQDVLHPIAVTVDTQAPAIAIPSTVLTTAHRLSFARVALTGVYTEVGGVAAIRVRADSGQWFDAAPVSGNAWRYAWYLNEDDINRPEPDGQTYLVTAIITDVVGRAAQNSRTVRVDLAPPTPVTVTLAYTNSQGKLTRLTPGQTIRDLSAPALIVTWTTSSDGSELAGYLAGWTTSETPDPALLTAYAPGANRRHTQTVGDVQAYYAHVAAQDSYGNRQWHTLGPVYVDRPATPDYIDLTGLGNLSGLYHGWMESGCSQIGAAREMARRAQTRQALTDIQRFYATWDANALRLAWTGANWDGDGDLFIYFDTVPGGATLAYNPYSATMTDTVIALPAGNMADYLIMVKDANTLALLRWNVTSGAWEFVDPPFPPDYYRLDTTLEPSVTDLYIPFDAIGIHNPSTATLKLVALASEQDALRLWAVMPDKNPLNSRWATHIPFPSLPLAGGGMGGGQYFTLTQQYEWTSLGAGLCPNAGQFTDADLLVDLTAEPPGVEVGYLEHNLLYLAPGAPLDADLDGEPDVPLPVDIHPELIGHGQVVTYTLHYANRGTGLAPGVRVTVTARGAIQLSHNPLTLDLGDVGAGVTATLEFTGTVNTSVYTHSAEINASVADAIHKTFDWLWVQHDIDTLPPESLGISSPLAYVKPYTNTVRGTVYDPSGVPTIRLSVQPLPVGTPFITLCTDATPQDGQWTCALNLGNAQNGARFKLQAQAWDRYGNGPLATDWITLTVDTLAPTIALDADADARLSGAVLGPNESLLLTGQVQDDRQAGSAEACFDQAYGLYCEPIRVTPGAAITGTWRYSLRAIGALDNETQAFRLYGLDGAGNRSAPLNRSYKIDNVPPVVTVAGHVNSIPTLSPTLVLSGTVHDGSGMVEIQMRVETPAGVVGWEPVARQGNTWRYTLNPQIVGRYTLRVKAQDPKGNTSQSAFYEVVVASLKYIYLPLVLRQK